MTKLFDDNIRNVSYIKSVSGMFSFSLVSSVTESDIEWHL